ncbi:hypothetical protein PM082_024343 [Marasmius tenuissimus]|nr:hypothetical protein PM082_024343 [Marasmius tenuissimus]
MSCLSLSRNRMRPGQLFLRFISWLKMKLVCSALPKLHIVRVSTSVSRHISPPQSGVIAINTGGSSREPEIRKYRTKTVVLSGRSGVRSFPQVGVELVLVSPVNMAGAAGDMDLLGLVEWIIAIHGRVWSGSKNQRHQHCSDEFTRITSLTKRLPISVDHSIVAYPSFWGISTQMGSTTSPIPVPMSARDTYLPSALRMIEPEIELGALNRSSIQSPQPRSLAALTPSCMLPFLTSIVSSIPDALGFTGRINPLLTGTETIVLIGIADPVIQATLSRYFLVLDKNGNEWEL